MKKITTTIFLTIFILLFITPLNVSAATTTVKHTMVVGDKATVSDIMKLNPSWKNIKYQSSDDKILHVSKSGKIKTYKIGKPVISIYDKKKLVAKIKVTITLKKPTNVTVKCLETGNADLSVNWNPVADATEYIVYRRIKGESWKKITTVKKPTYKDKATVGGKTHFYRIVASTKAGASLRSKASESVSITLPHKPYGVKIFSISDAGISYYWKILDNIAGYEVFRSYEKDGKYKLVGTHSNLEILHIDKTFNKKKTSVYYKSRSFVLDENQNKIYSKFSVVKRADMRNELLLEKDIIYMRSGSVRRLGAFYGWGNATNVLWSSSNESVATVSQNGIIKALAQGTTIITCEAKDGTASKSCTVVVDRPDQDPLHLRASRFTQITPGQWTDYKSTSKKATIMMVGDMMCTGAQQAAQGFETGNYNFEDSFDFVRPILKKSDLAVGNLETILSPSWPYMHEEAYINYKPNCNAPTRYLEAVKDGGIDAVVMGNNHNADAELEGLIDTIQSVEKYKMPHTGAFATATEPRYMLIEVGGIKVGYLSYVALAKGYNLKDTEWDPSDVATHLNYFDFTKVKNDIAAVRQAGAEYLIVYMHWGIKNSYDIKPDMITNAQILANLGADYIVGSHSHLVQSYDIITSATGKKVPCFYSLGDFQTSLDQVEGNRDSAILQIEIEKTADGKVVLSKEGYIPCYTTTKFVGRNFPTLPTDLNTNDSTLKQELSAADARIESHVGNKIQKLASK